MKALISENNTSIQYVKQGRLDASRASAIHSSLKGADFHTTEDRSIYYCSGLDSAPFNGIIEEIDAKVPSDEGIEEAIHFFNDRKLPFIWWTSAKNLEKHGFQFGGILTGIILDISKGIPKNMHYSSEIDVPEIKIKLVDSEKDIRSFSKLMVNLFGMKSNCLEPFHILSASIINSKERLDFLAFIDDKPVGTISLATSELSAGIWNLATLPKYRKKGVGTALVSAALAHAQKRKYEQVMAILMPKGLASGLFRKLGFKEVCKFPFHVYGVSPGELEK